MPYGDSGRNVFPYDDAVKNALPYGDAIRNALPYGDAVKNALPYFDAVRNALPYCDAVKGEKKTASTWPPLHVALRSETDVFTLLLASSTSEPARILIMTDGLIRRK